MANQVNFNGYLLRQFGAYIRTDLSALVQVNGVASGIIGVVGLAEKGPLDTATTISSYTELVNTFGDGPLVRHGLAAYVGGANTLVVVRMGGNDAQRANYNVVVNSTDGYTFRSRDVGTYGNGVAVRVEVPNVYATMVAATDEAVDATATYADISIPTAVTGVTNLDEDSYYVVGSWDSTASTGGYDAGDYAIFRWAGSRWVLADVETIKSTITARVGSVEESVEVPYYIHERPWVRALASTTATDYYYVLRNTTTNQVREIPRTWFAGEVADGAMDYDTFERIVADFKADDEVLFNGTTPADFQITLNFPTEFPFELAKHIVNYGGFGSGPSSLITVDDDDSEVSNPQFIFQGFTNLALGSNGSDGTGWTSTAVSEAGNFTASPTSPTQAWDTALGVLESEEVNFVQPAYLFGSQATFSAKYSFFKSLAARIVGHVNLMSNTPNRKFRTAILGLPSGQSGASTFLTAQQFLDEVEDISGTINSDRIQLWGGGFYSTALETVQAPRLYGAEWLASFVAGAHAAREVSVSLTFAQLAGIFTDGLEYAWTTSQRDELYGRSMAFALKRRTSTGATEFVAAHNYTSFTGAPSRGIQLFITRRIVDYMNSFLYKNLEENFIGRKSRGEQTAADIEAFVEALLNQLVSEDTLVAFEQLSVSADANDKTVYYVDFAFQPVTEIDFILTTNRLVYNLA